MTTTDPTRRRAYSRDERAILALGVALAVCSVSLLYGAIRTALGHG